MNAEERALVLARLEELEGWAEYIFEALTLDQRSEPMRKGMLERGIETQALRQLRELTWSLYDKLHLITTKIDLTRADQPAALGAVR